MNPLKATEGLSYPLPTTQKKPTTIFIPSTFHTAAHFGPLTWYLETQGSPSFALRMPSSSGAQKAGTCSSSSSSSGGGGGGGGMLAEDVATVRRVLEELVLKDEEDVVLVMHGYGAVPGCQAVTEGLERAGRVREGKVGGVRGLVFICGWLVEEGESIESTMLGLGEKAPSVNSPLLHPTPQPPSFLFDHDLPPPKATYWTSQLSPQHSLDIYTTPVQTIPCWATTSIPITYISCTKDPHARITDGMLARSKRENWIVRTIEAGHAPFLSRVEEVGDVILEAGKGREKVGGGGGGGDFLCRGGWYARTRNE